MITHHSAILLVEEIVVKTQLR